MGQNKALMRLGSKSLIEHVADALSPVVSQLGVVVAQREEYKWLPLELYIDLWPGKGPMSGIATALSAAQNQYCLIVACDMPFIQTVFFERLIALSSGYQLTIAEDQGGFLQPLAAIYHKSCLTVVKQMISEEVLRPQALLDRVSSRVVRYSQFSDLEGAYKLFSNLNTPKEFAQAEQEFQ
ncbi:MAG: molybdenum cofactor guanylyltransferase [Blastocatellia bacterium]|nr:molybdenum cofactor guanylyltransferase [Blastocatellia bacterium]